MINEGINDPAIFKAVFLAGGPGSGKSFIVGKTGIQALGFKLVNIDQAFEKALKDANIATTPDNIFSDRGQRIRVQAEILTSKRKRKLLDGRIGLVIDGTGRDYAKIERQVSQLRKIGYDVSMIFVNTTLDTALRRNRARSRTFPDSQVKSMWNSVQDNLSKFQKLFGRDIRIINNNDEDDYEQQALRAYKDIAKWAKVPPKSPEATAWLKSEKERRGIKEMADPKTKMMQSALKALEKMLKSRKGSVESAAYDITRSYDLGITARQLATLYKKKHDLDKEPLTSVRKIPDRFKKYAVAAEAYTPTTRSAPKPRDPEVQKLINTLRKQGWSIYHSRVRHRTENDIKLEFEKDNKEFEIVGSGNHWELFTGPTLSGRGKEYSSLKAAVQSQTPIREENGAGDEGTDKLRKKYQKDVPHEPVKNYVKEETLSREKKRYYDSVQRKLAPLARERNAAKKAGNPWPLMSSKEKEYQKVKSELEKLERMNEEATTTADIPDPKETAQGPKLKMKFVTDRRRRKDQPPVLLKRYRREE